MITIQEVREAMAVGQEAIKASKKCKAREWIVNEVLDFFLGEALSTGADRAAICVPPDIDCVSTVEVLKDLGYKVARLDYEDFLYDRNKSECKQLVVKWM